MLFLRNVLFACLVSGFGTTVASAQVVDWSGWHQAYWYYYNDYLYPIGQYRVAAYESAYDRAIRRNALAEARHYRLLIGQATGDLLRLQRRTRDLEATINRIESNGRALDSLVEGRITPRTTVAFTYLMRALGPGISEFGATTVPFLGKSDFELRSPYSTRYDGETHVTYRVENHLEDFAGGNMLQFIAWLKEKPFHVNPGSEAHFVLLDVRSSLAAAGYTWLSALMANREAIQHGHASIWAPIFDGTLGGLPAREPPRDDT